MSFARELLTLAPARRDHWPAARIALGVAVPLLLLLWLGRLDLSVYASFGAFTGIYGRHEPWASRLRHQLQAGALLSASVGLGLWLAHQGAGAVVTVAVTALISLGTALLSLSLGLRPAGALFFVFCVGVIAAIPKPASLGLGLGVAVLSAWLSIALGQWGAWVSARRRPDELAAVKPPPINLGDYWRYGLRHGLSVAVAGGLSTLLALGHNDWAMVAAAAVVGVLGHRARLQRSIHRVTGTLAGLLVTGALLWLAPVPWVMVLLAVVMQFFAEVYVARNYGLALVFVTPLALLMNQLAHPVAAAPLLTARAVETVLGAAVGLIAVVLIPSED